MPALSASRTRLVGSCTYPNVPPTGCSTLRLSRECMQKEEESAKEVLPSGKRVLVQVVPFFAPGEKYTIETGSLYAPIEAVLDGLIAMFALGMPVLTAAAIGGGRSPDAA